MKLTNDQINELRKKLGEYFLDYDIRYAKNVTHRYVLNPGNTPTVGMANQVPDVGEFVGILLNEPEY